MKASGLHYRYGRHRLVTLLVWIGVTISGQDVRAATLQEIVAQSEARNKKLLQLTPNTWVKFHVPSVFSQLALRRQGHAGLAYDSKRSKLLIFGSDTHGSNWDNSVHEFDPVQEKWTTHYPQAGKETYRADAMGNSIAGTERLLPWAMHTFDTVVYDPLLDALVVSAHPDHNPMTRSISAAKIHPTWIYSLGSRQWAVLPNNKKPYPNLFAGAAVHDPDRDVIVGYRGGIWELPRERDEWRLATKESHHSIHHNMEYDTKHRKIAVFGNYNPTNDVWVYTPGATGGLAGQWEKKVPQGDYCPKGQHFPVAFDQRKGVFLLVVDNDVARGAKPTASTTLVYDMGRNRYTKLLQAEMEPLAMNYMMVYDKRHEVFLLVTGDWQKPPTVWALKLQYQ